MKTRRNGSSVEFDTNRRKIAKYRPVYCTYVYIVGTCVIIPVPKIGIYKNEFMVTLIIS